MSGFAPDNGQVLGRPVGVVVAHDGSVLVTDGNTVKMKNKAKPARRTTTSTIPGLRKVPRVI
jgi:glucose/arabinose dehydrogenase